MFIQMSLMGEPTADSPTPEARGEAAMNILVPNDARRMHAVKILVPNDARRVHAVEILVPNDAHRMHAESMQSWKRMTCVRTSGRGSGNWF